MDIYLMAFLVIYFSFITMSIVNYEIRISNIEEVLKKTERHPKEIMEQFAKNLKMSDWEGIE